MPHLPRNLILMILLFYRTFLSCLEAEKCVKYYFTHFCGPFMTVQSQFQIFSDQYLPRASGPIWLCSRYKSKVPLLCPSSRSIEGRNIREGISAISISIKNLPLMVPTVWKLNIVFHFCLLWHWIRHKMYHKCCYSLTVAVECWITSINVEKYGGNRGKA